MKNVFFLIIFLSASVSSQPIHLPIQNIMQQTPVWCWAAVAQQIILAKQGPMNTPAQCALVAMAHGQHPNFCCAGGGNPNCVKTGSLQQIQYLIGQFGGSATSIQPPAHPQVLYNTLLSGRPIILQVQTGISSAHVVVLTGMSFLPNGTPLLHINDPLAHFTQPVPFNNLLPIWMSAIVVN
ncbi:TPA: hypothetical protein GRI67_23235 [Vibrio parahaemolyticus]|nr:hypothetical protein [Vibrio parahaemolyticus]HAS6741107.1 hypothetical protein [Vibrio parahaemolyticus]HAS6755853.1 hypothetical protein [Vibrio parahaemolyticus]HAS6775338.1 hypothetical protein [Vibrio parahaemolyticus]